MTIIQECQAMRTQDVRGLDNTELLWLYDKLSRLVQLHQDWNLDVPRWMTSKAREASLALHFKQNEALERHIQVLEAKINALQEPNVAALQAELAALVARRDQGAALQSVGAS